MENQAVEKVGLIPRSIIRTLDRFRQQFLSSTKVSAMREFRVSRQQMRTSVRCLITLLLIPLLVNFIGKTFFISPVIEYFWNNQQNQFFLNSYQENRAFVEMQRFEDKVFFESLIDQSLCNTQSLENTMSSKRYPFAVISCNPPFCGRVPALPGPSFLGSTKQVQDQTNKPPYKIDPLPHAFSRDLSCRSHTCFAYEVKKRGCFSQTVLVPQTNYKADKAQQTRKSFLQPLPYKMGAQFVSHQRKQNNFSLNEVNAEKFFDRTSLCINQKQKDHQALLASKFQQKTLQLAHFYNQESINGITDFIGDLLTLLTIRFLFIWMKPQIIILKSFLTESLYSLSDSTKSLLIILLTDLLVGYHSPKGWEVFTEMVLRHYGFPENRIFILFFIGTFPVMLDTIFKYWIFRHLNRISPSTVVTYHSMIE